MDEIATLSFAGRRVRLDFGEPHLRPGVGAHRLSLSMRSQADWLDPEATPATVSLLVEGEIWWDQAMGPFATLPAKVLTLRGYPVSENWPLHLSDEQLIAIESRRGIGDLVFRLDLAGTFLHEAASIHPTQTTQIGYRIAVSDWLVMLDQIGAEVGITVRVPSPLTDAFPPDERHPSLTQAAQRLREARQALRDGRYRDCVHSCRLVLENLAGLDPPPGVGVVRNVPAQKRSQSQRWAALHHSLVGLTHGASHDDPVTENFVWRKVDAEAVLAATAALMVRLRQ